MDSAIHHLNNGALVDTEQTFSEIATQGKLQ